MVLAGALVAGGGVVANTALNPAPAEALTCSSRDYRTVKTTTYVPGVGYFYDLKVTACGAQRMADRYNNVSLAQGAAGLALTLQPLFGFPLGVASIQAALTSGKISSCSKSFSSNIVITTKGSTVIGCKAYAGSVGGGTF